MKKISLFLVFLFIYTVSFAQTKYYKGEWSKTGTSYVFKAFVKLEFKGSKIEGEILWTIALANQLDSSMAAYYKNKMNRLGVEVISGDYNAVTRDVSFAGVSKIDPDNIIGLDIYALKLSSDGIKLFGKTESGGTGKGVFYAVAAPGSQEEYKTMREKVRQ